MQKKSSPNSFAKDDNSTIAITSASPSAKNMDFNGFVGSEKRSPSGENDLFTMDENSERKNNKRFSVCYQKLERVGGKKKRNEHRNGK